jgi:hypothetical protein
MRGAGASFRDSNFCAECGECSDRFTLVHGPYRTSVAPPITNPVRRLPLFGLGVVVLALGVLAVSGHGLRAAFSETAPAAERASLPLAGAPESEAAAIVLHARGANGPVRGAEIVLESADENARASCVTDQSGACEIAGWIGGRTRISGRSSEGSVVPRTLRLPRAAERVDVHVGFR